MNADMLNRGTEDRPLPPPLSLSLSLFGWGGGGWGGGGGGGWRTSPPPPAGSATDKVIYLECLFSWKKFFLVLLERNKPFDSY